MNRTGTNVVLVILLSGFVMAVGMLQVKASSASTRQHRVECSIYALPFLNRLTMEVEVCGKEKKVRVMNEDTHKPTYWVGPVYTDHEARMVACVMLTDGCPDYPHGQETDE